MTSKDTSTNDLLSKLTNEGELARPYANATCQELNEELQSLTEALQDATITQKPRLVAAIDAVQKERVRKGC